MKCEPTDIEYEASDKAPTDFYVSPPCVHCGLSIGYHWQTAEGKLFCTREVADSETASEPK